MTLQGNDRGAAVYLAGQHKNVEIMELLHERMCQKIAWSLLCRTMFLMPGTLTPMHPRLALSPASEGKQMCQRHSS